MHPLRAWYYFIRIHARNLQYYIQGLCSGESGLETSAIWKPANIRHIDAISNRASPKQGQWPKNGKKRY